MPEFANIDAYLAQAAPFAQPILNHIRTAVRTACPNVEEAIKWNNPFYVHKGIVCASPSFKKYCALIFWHAEMRKTLREQFDKKTLASWRKLTDIKQLPPKATLIKLFKQAVAINESGIKPPKKTPKDPKSLVIPADFQKAIKANQAASTVFADFSYSHRREYVRYIDEAKKPETRARRIEQSVAMIAEGKGRNWKYEEKQRSK